MGTEVMTENPQESSHLTRSQKQSSQQKPENERNETEDFTRRVQRELSSEELARIRIYKASTDEGNIVFQPRILGFGDEIQWEARVHIRGAMGPVRLTQESVDRISAPSDWYEKANRFLRTLQAQHPSLPSAIPEQPQPMLKEGADVELVHEEQ